MSCWCRRRTWPHEMTREAVRGLEYQMTRYRRVLPAEHDEILPFTRFLAGPADYTPTTFDPRELIIFNSGGGEVNHPVGGRVMKPKFLGGAEPDTAGKDRRVNDIHNVRVRRNPQGLYVHYHCVFRPDESVETAHDVIDRIEIALQDSLPEIKRVIAHAEPADRHRRAQ